MVVEISSGLPCQMPDLLCKLNCYFFSGSLLLEPTPESSLG
ncbi:hypothetical protein SLEP1_g58060 [Rubroshorea leprosula]|uniref:Uncharacterized protein n=1 Tax=Rubroshorea leprosula TaxID=152421 RepID=A0AAV5MN32_9ROSI|nr:hypothetical protein SLEP1_g58060 [Rubroshorea leprosula]